MKVVALIPAYNEEQTIAEVIEKTKPFVDQILVVDDASSDRTREIALSVGAHVVSHCINRGLGAGIGTGLAAAISEGADIVITLDADGQHDPVEIPLFVEAIRDGAEVVIGSRMLTHFKGMPWYRKIAQIIGNIVTFVLFGAKTTDSQSGYRAFTKYAASKIHIKTNRMEVSSEIIHEIHKNKLVYKEVPITAIYTDYSLSKGQGFFVGIKTLLKLVVRRIAG